MNSQAFGVDAQGRVWYVSFDGFHAPQLQVLDPATGQSTAQGEATGANGAAAVVSDPAGQFVFYATAEGGIVRVNTATGEKFKSGGLWLASIGERLWQMRHDAQGGLWLAINGPRSVLLRLNTVDMTVAKRVVLPSGLNYSEFAPESDLVAWLLSSDQLVRLNLADGSVTERPAESGTTLTSLSTAAGGGAAYTYSLTGTQQFDGPSFLEYWR